MSQLLRETFVCIDCETTGLDLEQDRIIEVAAVKFKIEETLDSLEFLVDPEITISELSISIHHITQEMVSGAPKIQEVLPNLLELVGNHTIVGHGVGFDIDMIANAATRAGIPCTIKHNSFLDTHRLARLYGESPVNSLEFLRQHFHIPLEVAHRAMSDVIVNVEVFKHLAKRYKGTQHMLEILSRPILLKSMPLGIHKGRPFRDIPLEYLRWAAKKDFDQDLLYSLRSELKRRKSGTTFGQSSSPFKDL